MLHGIIYRSEEAYHTKSLGYRIYTYTKDGKHYWDLLDIDKNLSNLFNTRSDDINENLGDGEHSAAAKARAAETTRQPKQMADLDQLKKRWQNTIERNGYDFKAEKAKLSQKSKNITRNTPRSIFNHAISHLEEGKSVFTHNELLHAMLSRGLGDIRYTHANKEISRAILEKRLILRDNTKDRGQRLLTTATLQKTERELIDLERSDRLSRSPILSRSELQSTTSGSNLNQAQAKALSQTMLSTSLVIGVQGLAGVGKSYTANTMVTTMESKGLKPIILAPSSSVKTDLAKDMGRKTQTLQAFLKRPEGTKDHVIILDEASMVGTKDMQSLLSIASQRGFNRVILMGDKRQLSSVQAGAPFALLQSTGMRTAIIDKVMRQEDKVHRDMIGHAYKGEVDQALSILEPNLHETEYDDIDQACVKAWLRSPDRASTAIIANTNARIDNINAQLRVMCP